HVPGQQTADSRPKKHDTWERKTASSADESDNEIKNNSRYEKKYNPQGVASSLALLPRVGCVTLANPALSKV
ncbi:MAG: hypothetical protein ACFNLP_09060, partial [Segatella oulorum]